MKYFRWMLGLFAAGLAMLLLLPGRAAEPVDIAARLAAAKVEKYADGPGYSEGPTWRAGEVFFCSGRLLRVTTALKLESYADIGPAGTYLRGDGHLLIAANKPPSLMDLGPDGKLAVIVDQFDGNPLNSLNDLTIDARGNVYWTDPSGSGKDNPVGKIFRLRPTGEVAQLAANLAFPNGLDVDPASKHLYVIESQTHKILRYPLPAEDQPLGQAEVFYDLGGSGGDGCAFDAAGNLWVADFHRPDTKQGRITVLDPQGKVLGHLPVPAEAVSNVSFGGPQHDEIFISTGGPPGVFHAKVGVPGFRQFKGVPLKPLRYVEPSGANPPR